MTHTELEDNLTYLAAEQMLAGLVEKNLLSTEEAEQIRKELRRRLRPTVL